MNAFHLLDVSLGKISLRSMVNHHDMSVTGERDDAYQSGLMVKGVCPQVSSRRIASQFVETDPSSQQVTQYISTEEGNRKHYDRTQRVQYASRLPSESIFEFQSRSARGPVVNIPGHYR